MGNSALHIACLNGQGHIIAELMKHGASVNAVNNKNQVSGKLRVRDKYCRQKRHTHDNENSTILGPVPHSFSILLKRRVGFTDRN